MRIVEMHPEEKWPVRQLAEPAERMIDDVARPPLNGFVTIHSVTPQMKSSVINIKSAIKARSRAVQRIQDKRTDKSASVIPMLMQDVWQIGELRRQRDAKVVDMIELRVCSREDSCMGRGRQRHMRISAREGHTLLRHCVQ